MRRMKHYKAFDTSDKYRCKLVSSTDSGSEDTGEHVDGGGWRWAWGTSETAECVWPNPNPYLE